MAAAPDETWRGIDSALCEGGRGLVGGDTLSGLLARLCRARTKGAAPRLSYEQVLSWADAHKTRTGRWPQGELGPILGAPGETWSAVRSALRRGGRGLPGGTSLPKLLARHRGAPPYRAHPPPLRMEQILRWADAHHRRTGRWPGAQSGPVVGAAGETWSAIVTALCLGQRGLPDGDSLHQLLVRTGRKRPAAG